jgi:molybdopterin converting factor small subunit
LIVRFKSFGTLRRVVGQKEVALEVPDGSSVLGVVEAAIRTWGKDVEHLVMDGGSISGNMIVMLNMKDIDTLSGPNTPVRPNDEITILPHVQGG